MLDVKTFSEAVELSTAHARKQFEQLSEQTKELAALAHKVANESAEPLRNSVNKTFRKVA
jgi:phasin family protein